MMCTQAPSGGGIFGRRLDAPKDQKQVASSTALAAAAKKEKKEEKEKKGEKTFKEKKDEAKKHEEKRENTRKEPTPLSVQVEQATGKSSKSDKSTHKKLDKARESKGAIQLPSTKGAAAFHSTPLSASHSWEADQAQLMKQAASLRRVALVSVATGGFMTVDPPPHSLELFLRADAEEMSLRTIFAVPNHKTVGGIISFSTKALLNPCQLSAETGVEPSALCTGAPSILKTPKVAKANRKEAAFHRKLLTSRKTSMSDFEIELISP